MEKAKIIEQLIKENGFTIRAFAQKCGIPESTLYTILKKGAGRASTDNIITICDHLGITVEQLKDMANGESAKSEPSYEDVEQMIARNSKGFSTEQKMKLIKLLSEIDL